VATESATAALIVATLFTPLVPTLILLPLLGLVLDGTSAIIYGTAPELAPSSDTGRAFALFYTAALIVPMALRLGPSLGQAVTTAKS
jgi:hypothetical protein